MSRARVDCANRGVGSKGWYRSPHYTQIGHEVGSCDSTHRIHHPESRTTQVFQLEWKRGNFGAGRSTETRSLKPRRAANPFRVGNPEED